MKKLLNQLRESLRVKNHKSSKDHYSVHNKIVECYIRHHGYKPSKSLVNQIADSIGNHGPEHYDWSIDHIIPVSAFIDYNDAWMPENIAWLPKRFNIEKKDMIFKSVDEFQNFINSETFLKYNLSAYEDRLRNRIEWLKGNTCLLKKSYQ